MGKVLPSSSKAAQCKACDGWANLAAGSRPGQSSFKALALTRKRLPQSMHVQPPPAPP